MMDPDRFDWIIGGLCWLTLVVIALLFVFGVIG